MLKKVGYTKAKSQPLKYAIGLHNRVLQMQRGNETVGVAHFVMRAVAVDSSVAT